MTPPPPDDANRRLANLQAVAAHHARGRPTADPPLKAPAGAPSRWRKRLATLGPIGLVLAFTLGKAKLLLPLLKVAKLSTFVSMFVAVWVYALIWGLPFAVGFVLLIFVHELGHALVMHHQGIRAGAPVFIPFVGAVIAMKEMPRNAYVEALVGIGGPVLGSVGALACMVIGSITGSMFWYALAYTGFLINLFNLIPVSPLDGGRIVGVISRWLWVVGYAVGIVMLVITRSPILFLVLLVGLFGLVRTIRGPRKGYFDVEPRKRIAMGVAYFALAGLLALAMQATDRILEDVRALG